ncbi:ABC transporter substrate-binding protein [Dermabacter hominis]|uniref:ABC transporter substrate-binding protein n=1 Tax=Dermabacter hominis TaxID=36740 RepID=UPI00077424D1|nr:sugar ABC transporter substrate-binding protein [Dermabacter hominis]
MATSPIARRSLLAAGGAAFAAAAAGCGGGNKAAIKDATNEIGDDPKKIKGAITYAYWDINQEAMLTDVMKAFNKKYPNVKVQLNMVPFKDYFTKLRAQASSKALPDVFWMNGPNFRSYAENGQLASLKALVDDGLIDPNKYPSALVDMYTVDGELFATCKDVDCVGIWYNKKLFDQAGVAYPDETWTLDTYKEKALELTDKLPDGVWGCAEVFSRTASYYHSIAINGGWVISDDKKKSGYDDPKTIEGVKFWRDLIEIGACPSREFLAENSCYGMFEGGQVAMQWSGNWRVGALIGSSVKNDCAVAYLPGGDDRKTAVHGLGHVISANTENLAASQALVTFLAGEEAAKISAESGIALPALEGTQDPYVDAQPGYDLSVFVDQAENYAVPFPVSKTCPEWEELEGEHLSKVFDGEISAEEGCKALAKAMNEVLKKENS